MFAAGKVSGPTNKPTATPAPRSTQALVQARKDRFRDAYEKGTRLAQYILTPSNESGELKFTKGMMTLQQTCGLRSLSPIIVNAGDLGMNFIPSLTATMQTITQEDALACVTAFGIGAAVVKNRFVREVISARDGSRAPDTDRLALSALACFDLVNSTHTDKLAKFFEELYNTCQAPTTSL